MTLTCETTDNKQVTIRTSVIYKDLETIQKYNKERRQEQWVPDDVLIQLYNKYEPLTEEARNCYDEVIEINGYFS